MKHNWLAIVVVVVLAQVLGFLWYGVLFQDPWASGWGIDMATVDQSDPMPFVISIASSLTAALGLSWLVQRLSVTDGIGGARLGFLIWLCFVALTLWTHYTFGQVGMSAIWVDLSNGAITMIVAGFILGAWRTKPVT